MTFRLNLGKYDDRKVSRVLLKIKKIKKKQAFGKIRSTFFLAKSEEKENAESERPEVTFKYVYILTIRVLKCYCHNVFFSRRRHERILREDIP